MKTTLALLLASIVLAPSSALADVPGGGSGDGCPENPTSLCAVNTILGGGVGPVTYADECGSHPGAFLCANVEWSPSLGLNLCTEVDWSCVPFPATDDPVAGDPESGDNGGVFGGGSWHGWDTYDPLHGLGPLLDLIHLTGILRVSPDGGDAPPHVIQWEAHALVKGKAAVLALDVDAASAKASWVPGLVRLDHLDLLLIGAGPQAYVDWLAASFKSGSCVNPPKIAYALTGQLLPLRSLHAGEIRVAQVVEVLRHPGLLPAKTRLRIAEQAMTPCDLWSILEHVVNAARKNGKTQKLILVGR